MPPYPDYPANPGIASCACQPRHLVKKKLPVYEICYKPIFNYPLVWLKCI